MRHSFRCGQCDPQLCVRYILPTCSSVGKPPVSPTMPFELVGGFPRSRKCRDRRSERLEVHPDTGATHSLIDRKAVDRLRLHRRSGDVSFDRHVDVEWADIPDLRVGPLRGEALRIMVVKLAPEYLEFAEHADGIIGLDLLSKVESSPSIRWKNCFFPTGKRWELLIVPWHALSSPLVVQGFLVHLAVDTGLEGIVSEVRIGFASDY